MKNYSGYDVLYDEDTPSDVIYWIERAHQFNSRVRVFYGDTDSKDFERVHGRKPDPGRDWGEEYDVSGTIGVSTGHKPIVLLINNSRSTGGGAIMTDRIVRMIVNGREVYRHPNYHSKFDNAQVVISELAPEYSHAVYTEEEGEVARFHSEKSARNYLSFMQGKRLSK